jgi:hypothetical protein
MPAFTIYQSEAGVRAENAKLKRDLEAARADNARLRAMVGEPAIVVAAPAVQATGETFTVGNCSVQIGPAGGGAPAISPALASSRVKGQRPAPLVSVAQATAPVAKQEQEVEEDSAVLRFSMVELK